MIGKNNDEMRERDKNSFHLNSIKANKYKNKYFNIIKKIGKKAIIPVLSSREERQSLIRNKSDKKEINNILSLSKLQIDYSKLQEIKYFNFCNKFANVLLKNKYDCSKRAKSELHQKEEIISIYNSYQIDYLIEKRKSRVYCRLKEFLLLNKNEEYLANIYKQRESRIMIKYLLFFVYDKDKMTFNEKRTEQIDKDKIKSLLEKIIPQIKKRYFLMEYIILI